MDDFILVIKSFNFWLIISATSKKEGNNCES